MEFSPQNPIVQYCLQGMAMEAQSNNAAALDLFLKAWHEARNNFEKFLSAHFVARQQSNLTERLQWLHTALQHAIAADDTAAKSAYPTLHSNIAKCYEDLNDTENAKKHYELAASFKDVINDHGPFYHGTKADLQIGDSLIPGHLSNYQDDLQMNHIYFTAMTNGAGLAAALAKGEGRQRVFVIEPTGSFENDPNVTDKKFPGNLTRSYRTLLPLKIISEIPDWEKQTPESICEWQTKLAQNKGDIIN